MKITSPHNKFILSSIVDVLKDGISSFDLAGGGIETYPLSDYVMQSIFLKMTGFQEQKLKCICWEIATYDYEYRYERYGHGWKLKECSTLEHKTTVFKDLLDAIKGYDPSFDCKTVKTDILSNVNEIKERMFDNSSLIYFNQFLFQSFKDNTDLFTEENFLNGSSLLSGELSASYEILYKQRNRCAHNLLSYQQNLPDLNVLKADKDNLQGNYYCFFLMLILIDEIFIELYKKYEQVRNF